jgi:hypothetical protein
VARRLAAAVVVAGFLVAPASAARVTPERRAITPHDHWQAKRANLRLADVPAGLRVVANLTHPFGPPLACKGFHPDLSDLTVTGEVASPVYGRAGLAVFSMVQIFRNVHDERADWARTHTRPALACGAKEMAQTRTTPKVVIKSYAALRAPRLGDRAVLYRFTGVVSTGGQRLKMWTDLASVARGRAEATLSYVSYGHVPSAKVERALLAKLERRLRAVH